MGRPRKDSTHTGERGLDRQPLVLEVELALETAHDLNAELIAEAARSTLEAPVLAVGGNVVGDALARQLAPITRHLEHVVLPRCGHIVPADAPQALLDVLTPFLAASKA